MWDCSALGVGEIETPNAPQRGDAHSATETPAEALREARDELFSVSCSRLTSLLELNDFLAPVPVRMNHPRVDGARRLAPWRLENLRDPLVEVVLILRSHPRSTGFLEPTWFQASPSGKADFLNTASTCPLCPREGLSSNFTHRSVINRNYRDSVKDGMTGVTAELLSIQILMKSWPSYSLSCGTSDDKWDNCLQPEASQPTNTIETS
jgi:hypothetical protein